MAILRTCAWFCANICNAHSKDLTYQPNRKPHRNPRNWVFAYFYIMPRLLKIEATECRVTKLQRRFSKTFPEQGRLNTAALASCASADKMKYRNLKIFFIQCVRYYWRLWYFIKPPVSVYLLNNYCTWWTVSGSLCTPGVGTVWDGTAERRSHTCSYCLSVELDWRETHLQYGEEMYF